MNSFAWKLPNRSPRPPPPSRWRARRPQRRKSVKLAKNSKTTPSPAPRAAAAATPVALAALPVTAKTSASPLPSVPAVAAPPVGGGGVALASTAGGGSWKTYPAGKMPAGRLITTNDLNDVAERGLAGERVYLRGQFVVNFAESHRAVLAAEKQPHRVCPAAGGAFIHSHRGGVSLRRRRRPRRAPPSRAIRRGPTRSRKCASNPTAS